LYIGGTLGLMWTMKARDCTAVLFDLDGVLTDTASVHERAWGRLFTAVFEAEAARGATVAPYTTADYFAYIDGKPRTKGVRAMLASRGIDLPDGETDDDPDAHTVNGLGNRKNAMFLAELDEHGATTFQGATELLDWLDLRAIPKGVVSSSRNAEPVLRAAGMRHKVDIVVDGVVAMDLGIAGKPAPDTYLHAARQLHADAAHTVVVEDATSGVEAGRRGGFWVVGVDRGAGRDALLQHGADVVVTGLDEIFANDRRDGLLFGRDVTSGAPH
jgi:beta-phosphoglucomutase family hydrolase